MEISAIVQPGASASDTTRVAYEGFAQRAAEFAAELDTARSDDETRAAAEQIVGIALILPLLKQARNDPFRSDLFHGGQGEEAFGSQQDQMIADNLARRGMSKLVDAVYDRMTNHATHQATARELETVG